MSIMRKCVDPSAPPVVGAMCIVLTEDDEVPLRTAYWCSGVWRDPHTAQRLVPLVLSWCLMREAVFLLSLPRCREELEELDAALDGLAKRGVIAPEQTEAADRRRG